VLRSSLDGKNLEVVLLEFGIRLHRVIYDHIQQFSINEMGAMVIICDMNEYRRAVKEFKVLVNINFHPPSLPGSNGWESNKIWFTQTTKTKMKMLTFLSIN